MKDVWQRIAHWLHCAAHLFGWNRGTVVAASDCCSNVWIGFRCASCGALTGVHIITTPPPADTFT